MKQRIVIFPPTVPNFQLTSLFTELCCKETREGNEVFAAIPDYRVTAGAYSRYTVPGFARACDRTMRRFMDVIGRGIHGVERAEMGPCEGTGTDIKRLKDLARRPHAEIRKYEVNDICVGEAALSSYYGLTRCPYDESATDRALMFRLLRCAEYMARAGRRLYDRVQPARVLIPNGRLAHYRPQLEEAKRRGLLFHAYDYGCSPQHYSLYENSTPFDVDYFYSEALATFAKAPPGEAERTAINYFEDRRKGRTTSEVPFVRFMARDRVPIEMTGTRRHVGVFTSSEDEFIICGYDWDSGMFKSQLDGLRWLRDVVEADGGRTHLWIRLHPHSSGLSGSYHREFFSLGGPNTTVIRPLDYVDSYAMVERVDTVVSFGSTIGAEATFWGRPSVLLGRSFYEPFDLVWQPRTLEEAKAMVLGEMTPKPKESTIPYGYYLATIGNRCEFYEAESLSRGRLFGEVIQCNATPFLVARFYHYVGWLRTVAATHGWRTALGQVRRKMNKNSFRLLLGRMG